MKKIILFFFTFCIMLFGLFYYFYNMTDVNTLYEFERNDRSEKVKFTLYKTDSTIGLKKAKKNNLGVYHKESKIELPYKALKKQPLIFSRKVYMTTKMSGGQITEYANYIYFGIIKANNANSIYFRTVQSEIIKPVFTKKIKNNNIVFLLDTTQNNIVNIKNVVYIE